MSRTVLPVRGFTSSAGTHSTASGATTPRPTCSSNRGLITYTSAERDAQLEYRHFGGRDELLLALDVDRREQLVLMNRLQQVFVLLLTLFLGVGKGRHVAQFSVQLQLRRAAFGQFEQLL